MKKGDKVSSEELEKWEWRYLGMHSNLWIWGQETERIFWNPVDEKVYLVYEKSASFCTANNQRGRAGR